MDRETKRLIEEFRRNEAGPLENNVIDELVGGELDREEFIRRADHVRDRRRHDRHAPAARRRVRSRVRAPRSSRGRRGGTIRLGIPVFGASLEPYLLNEGGSLAFAGIPGEYLTFTTRDGRVVPWLATSWRPNADATVWTFQIRRGVKFHNGKTTHRRGRRGEHEAVRRPAELERRALGPFFDAAGVSARGQYTVVVPTQVADRRVPVPPEPDDVPGDHPARRDRGEAGHVGRERDDRHRPVPAAGATSTSGAPSSSATPRTGAAGRRSTACGSRSSRAAHRSCSRCEPDRSTSRCSSRRRRARRSRTTRSTTYYSCRPRLTARCACGPTSRRSVTRGSAAPSRS